MITNSTNSPQLSLPKSPMMKLTSFVSLSLTLPLSFTGTHTSCSQLPELQREAACNESTVTCSGLGQQHSPVTLAGLGDPIWLCGRRFQPENWFCLTPSNKEEKGVEDVDSGDPSAAQALSFSPACHGPPHSVFSPQILSLVLTVHRLATPGHNGHTSHLALLLSHAQ